MDAAKRTAALLRLAAASLEARAKNVGHGLEASPAGIGHPQRWQQPGGPPMPDTASSPKASQLLPAWIEPLSGLLPAGSFLSWGTYAFALQNAQAAIWSLSLHFEGNTMPPLPPYASEVPGGDLQEPDTYLQAQLASSEDGGVVLTIGGQEGDVVTGAVLEWAGGLEVAPYGGAPVGFLAGASDDINYSEWVLPPALDGSGCPVAVTDSGKEVVDLDEGCDPNGYTFFFVPQSETQGHILVAVQHGYSMPAELPNPTFTHEFVDLDKVLPPSSDPCQSLGGIQPSGWVSRNHILPTINSGVALLPQYRGLLPEGEGTANGPLVMTVWDTPSVAVYAPGKGVLYELVCRVLYNSNVTSPGSKAAAGRFYFDYTVRIAATTTYGVALHHIAVVNTDVVPAAFVQRVNARALAAATGEEPTEESGLDSTSASVVLNVPVEPGDVLGWAGGVSGALEAPELVHLGKDDVVQLLDYAQIGMDIGGVDFAQEPHYVAGKHGWAKVYPEEALHGSSALQYFVDRKQPDDGIPLQLKTAVNPALVKSGNAKTRIRNMMDSPPDARKWWGRFDWDKEGTLAGNWFMGGDGKNLPDATEQMAFFFDWRFPQQMLITIGDPSLWLFDVSEQQEPPVPYPEGTPIYRVLNLSAPLDPFYVDPESHPPENPLKYHIQEGRCSADGAKTGVLLVGFGNKLSEGETVWQLKTQVFPGAALDEATAFVEEGSLGPLHRTIAYLYRNPVEEAKS